MPEVTGKMRRKNRIDSHKDVCWSTFASSRWEPWRSAVDAAKTQTSLISNCRVVLTISSYQVVLILSSQSLTSQKHSCLLFSFVTRQLGTVLWFSFIFFLVRRLLPSILCHQWGANLNSRSPGFSGSSPCPVQTDHEVIASSSLDGFDRASFDSVIFFFFLFTLFVSRSEIIGSGACSEIPNRNDPHQSNQYVRLSAQNF